MWKKFTHFFGGCAAGLLVLPILSLVLLFGASAAKANTGLTIQPVKASHTINPGETVSGVISLTNASEDDARIEVTVEDFIPAAGAGCNLSAEPKALRPLEIGLP